MSEEHRGKPQSSYISLLLDCHPTSRGSADRQTDARVWTNHQIRKIGDRWMKKLTWLFQKKQKIEWPTRKTIKIGSNVGRRFSDYRRTCPILISISTLSVDGQFPKCDCGFRHCKRIQSPELYTVSKLVLRLSLLCFSGCWQHIFHRREALLILGGTWTIPDRIFHQYLQRTNYKQNSLLYMCLSPFSIILVISGLYSKPFSLPLIVLARNSPLGMQYY